MNNLSVDLVFDQNVRNKIIMERRLKKQYKAKN